MKIKNLFILVLSILMLYPLFSGLQAGNTLGTVTIPKSVERSISLYHLSIWLTWLVLVCVAIFHKWTTKSNFFFSWTYIFLFISYFIYGYLIQEMLARFEISFTFQDNFTLGVFTVVRNFVIAAALTGILQALIWWFTRKWHRR